MTGGFDNTKENEQARRLQAKLDLASAITYAESLGKVVDEQKAENEALRGERDALAKRAEKAERELAREERDHEGTMTTRDAFEEFIGDMAHEFDPTAEWSNLCDLRDVVREGVGSMQFRLSTARQVVEAAKEAAKFIKSEYAAANDAGELIPDSNARKVYEALIDAVYSPAYAPPKLSSLPADERLAASVRGVAEAATPPSREVEAEDACPDCKGTGSTYPVDPPIPDVLKCATCDGDGKFDEVSIPPSRDVAGFECYATFRKRENENNGREFFFHAVWHNEATRAAGERVVKGRFVPDEPQPANVSSKSELEDRAFALELREVELRKALEFYADPETYLESEPIGDALEGDVPIDNDEGRRARAALAAPTGQALASSDPEGHRQAIADGEHDRQAESQARTPDIATQVIGCAMAVVAHWNEFGAEHHFEEDVARLEKKLNEYRAAPAGETAGEGEPTEYECTQCHSVVPATGVSLRAVCRGCLNELIKVTSTLQGDGGEVERLREANPLQLDGKLTERGERLMNWASLNFSASPEIMLLVGLVRQLASPARLNGDGGGK